MGRAHLNLTDNTGFGQTSDSKQLYLNGYNICYSVAILMFAHIFVSIYDELEQQKAILKDTIILSNH